MVDLVRQGVQALFDKFVNIYPLASMKNSIDFPENGRMKAAL
jgi:hypothetical protein